MHLEQSAGKLCGASGRYTLISLFLPSFPGRDVRVIMPAAGKESDWVPSDSSLPLQTGSAFELQCQSHSHTYQPFSDRSSVAVFNTKNFTIGMPVLKFMDDDF